MQIHWGLSFHDCFSGHSLRHILISVLCHVHVYTLFLCTHTNTRISVAETAYKWYIVSPIPALQNGVYFMAFSIGPQNALQWCYLYNTLADKEVKHSCRKLYTYVGTELPFVSWMTVPTFGGHIIQVCFIFLHLYLIKRALVLVINFCTCNGPCSVLKMSVTEQLYMCKRKRKCGGMYTGMAVPKKVGSYYTINTHKYVLNWYESLTPTDIVASFKTPILFVWFLSLPFQ